MRVVSEAIRAAIEDNTSYRNYVWAKLYPSRIYFQAVQYNNAVTGADDVGIQDDPMPQDIGVPASAPENPQVFTFFNDSGTLKVAENGSSTGNSLSVSITESLEFVVVNCTEFLVEMCTYILSHGDLHLVWMVVPMLQLLTKLLYMFMVCLIRVVWFLLMVMEEFVRVLLMELRSISQWIVLCFRHISITQVALLLIFVVCIVLLLYFLVLWN